MKFLTSFSATGALILSLHAADLDIAANKLECAVLEEQDKIIQCTFYAVRMSADRPVTFHWKSDVTPQDDRERTFILPSGHGSVYDYRYYYGRAPGKWTVSVTDGAGSTLAETSFTID